MERAKTKITPDLQRKLKSASIFAAMDAEMLRQDYLLEEEIRMCNERTEEDLAAIRERKKQIKMYNDFLNEIPQILKKHPDISGTKHTQEELIGNLLRDAEARPETSQNNTNDACVVGELTDAIDVTPEA